MKQIDTTQTGFSLIEVTVAAAIFSMGLGILRTIPASTARPVPAGSWRRRNWATGSKNWPPNCQKGVAWFAGTALRMMVIQPTPPAMVKGVW